MAKKHEAPADDHDGLELLVSWGMIMSRRPLEERSQLRRALLEKQTLRQD